MEISRSGDLLSTLAVSAVALTTKKLPGGLWCLPTLARSGQDEGRSADLVLDAEVGEAFPIGIEGLPL